MGGKHSKLKKGQPDKFIPTGPHWVGCTVVHSLDDPMPIENDGMEFAYHSANLPQCAVAEAFRVSGSTKDTRIPVDWKNDEGMDVKAIGELKMKFNGKTHVGSASVFSIRNKKG